MPGMPEDADDKEELEEEATDSRSLHCIDRKSVRLGLPCSQNRRWYCTVLLDAVEVTEAASDGIKCVNDRFSGGISNVASPLC
jgi:hypothetical protein